MIALTNASVISLALAFFALGAIMPFLKRDFRVSLPPAIIGSLLTLFAGAYGVYHKIEGEVLFGLLQTAVKIELLNGFFIAFLGLVGLFVSLYLLHYDMEPRHLTFAIAYNGALASALLFLATDNLEKLTLSYELIALFTLALFLSTVPRRGRITARNYIVLTQVFGIIPLLIATSLAYSAVGSLHGLTFEALRENLDKLPVGVWLLYALYLFPALVRSGVFPLHTWVPRVYQRLPSPLVPVFIALEGTGVYFSLRIFFETLPHSQVVGYSIAVLGTVSVFATLYSFKEIRLKTKFAYHSVMDVGVSYFALGSALVLGGTLGTVALVGAILHTLYQTLYKSAIFFGLGAIEHYGEEPNICSLRKLLKGHVITLFISLSAFSMAGVPPLAAFVSKWLIYEASFGTANVYLWIMGLTVAFLGLFPLASILQVRRINRLLCKREVEREEVPLYIRSVTGVVAFLGFFVAIFPLMVFPWLQHIVGELIGVEIESLSKTFFASPITVFAVALLFVSTYAGWKIGRMPTDRVSELLLIFYNMGDILRFTAEFFLKEGKKAYLTYILPVIKVVPKHELPLVKDYDDALDYPVKHLDEAMFMPLIRLFERLAKWGGEKNLDMNALISGFAVALALLIVLLGVVS
ncbi:complex I subunit 5 family protein [Thermococcus stetteri]|uniref:complex I subunit 5 family protein n=1 Tax=Thermococcus stetteri TaxID=49900 RepID=UPI001FD7BFDE|nr:complex I subunit 5 family protein [Thermococcus stetteri]MBP1912097.1 formate hydrogenlyase subunit 3/multisubunit Na+/H+ antiporter MnhD subunit [Thermococcus stetteri]